MHGRHGFKVDQDAVKTERALGGRFLLFSTNLFLNGWEMYKTYFTKDAIEKVFRANKGDLSLVTVRYRRKDYCYLKPTKFRSELLCSKVKRPLLVFKKRLLNRPKREGRAVHSYGPGIYAYDP